IAAQGGINAAKNYQNDGDSVYRLFYDTIKGGDYRAREANVYRLAEVSNQIIDQCVAQGVPFAREYGGLLDNRSFGGAQVNPRGRVIGHRNHHALQNLSVKRNANQYSGNDLFRPFRRNRIGENSIHRLDFSINDNIGVSRHDFLPIPVTCDRKTTNTSRSADLSRTAPAVRRCAADHFRLNGGR
ncbi:MAG: FAD-binding protein, partial [Clostridiales bacterium]